MRQATQLLTASILGIAIGASSLAWACGSNDLPQLASDAVGDNPALAEYSIDCLRAAGPAGLEALLDAHRPLIERAIADPQTTAADPLWQRLHAAIDAVAGQRDAHVSKLYWYTDVELAKQAARRQNKPIVSLRLLGKLTDELSCANSRFFRTVLYSNEEVSRALRDRFVLHWESVRPVPKVTIDFGDGRTMVRTLTGNSIHHILDSDGRPVDALPGLYGPKTFLLGLNRTAALVTKLSKVDPGMWATVLADYHRQRVLEVTAQWKSDLRRLGAATLEQSIAAKANPDRTVAFKANRLTAAKAPAEAPLLTVALAEAEDLTAVTNDDVWQRIAQLHSMDAALDSASIRLIRAQHPPAAQAGELAVSKRAVEDPLLRLVADFQRTVAVDSVRNEYTLHRRIHQWFAEGNFSGDVDAGPLNERVYAELFLTPSSDPWLGLAPDGVYTALDRNGISQ